MAIEDKSVVVRVQIRIGSYCNRETLDVCGTINFATGAFEPATYAVVASDAELGQAKKTVEAVSAWMDLELGKLYPSCKD